MFNAIFDDHVPGQPLIRKRSDLSHIGTWRDSILFCGITQLGPFPGVGLEVKI